MPIRSSSRWRARATLLILTLALATGGFASAQDVQLECLSFPKRAIEEIELLVGEGKTIPITLQSHALTVPQKVPSLARWKLGKSSMDAQGKFHFTVYGEVKPLSVAKQLLLVVRKGAKVADGLNLLSLDAGKTNFGASKMLIMNLTNQQIAGVVGGRKFLLTKGKHATIQPKANRGKNLCFADLRYQRDGKWRSFFSTNWPVLDNARGLVFIYRSSKSKSPKIHSIVDSLRPLPAAP